MADFARVEYNFAWNTEEEDVYSNVYRLESLLVYSQKLKKTTQTTTQTTTNKAFLLYLRNGIYLNKADSVMHIPMIRTVLCVWYGII